MRVMAARTRLCGGRDCSRLRALLASRASLAGLFLGLAQLAAALLVGFGLAGGGGVDPGRNDLDRQGDDIDRGVGDGADDAADRASKGSGEKKERCASWRLACTA